MHRSVIIIFAALALGLAACSGDYSNGGGGITPPVAQGIQSNPGLPNVSPSPGLGNGHPTPTPSAPPGDSVTYALAAFANGVRCPDVGGYSCIVHLNEPPATPSPAPKTRAFGSPSPSPSPSPTPSPTPTPSPSPSSSAKPSNSPKPSPTPAITLQLQATPHAAPAMVNPDTRAAGTTALIALRATANESLTLHGNASVDFILPADQIGGRGFAVQLFAETTARHNRHNDKFMGSFSRSTTNGTTLHFAITPPQVTMKTGETWLLVLYANERPPTSPAPSASASPSSSPSTPPSPSASPSP